MNKLNLARLFFVLILTLLVSACGGGGGGDGGAGNGGDAQQGESDKLVKLEALAIGDCTVAATDDVYVSEFKSADCGAPHEMEVAGFTTLDSASVPANLKQALNGSGTDYPGFLEVTLQAYNACRAVFEDYTGTVLRGSGYDIDTVSPSAASWRDGDRDVVCLVVGLDGELLTGSVAR